MSITKATVTVVELNVTVLDGQATCFEYIFKANSISSSSL